MIQLPVFRYHLFTMCGVAPLLSKPVYVSNDIRFTPLCFHLSPAHLSHISASDDLLQPVTPAVKDCVVIRLMEHCKLMKPPAVRCIYIIMICVFLLGNCKKLEVSRGWNRLNYLYLRTVTQSESDLKLKPRQLFIASTVLVEVVEMQPWSECMYGGVAWGGLKYLLDPWGGQSKPEVNYWEFQSWDQ